MSKANLTSDGIQLGSGPGRVEVILGDGRKGVYS